MRQEAERKAQEEAERLRLEAERLRLETERLRLEAELKEKEETERKTREEVENNFIVCPNCGAKVSADVNFCSNCAYPIALQNKGSELQQDSTLPPPLTVVATRHRCHRWSPTPQQGRTIASTGGAFITTATHEQEEYFHCPICGAAVKEGSAACINCEVRSFTGATPSAPVQSTNENSGVVACHKHFLIISTSDNFVYISSNRVI